MTSAFSTVDSLQNLAIHYVSYNLLKLSPKQYVELLYLPNNAKNKILRKTLCVCSVSAKLGRPLFQQIFYNLVNDCTFELDLSNVFVDASIVKSLRRCTKLQQLTLDGLNDNSLIQDVKETFRELVHLRKLTITNSSIVRPDIIMVIVEAMLELAVLDLRGCSNFNDTCANIMIGRLDKLRHLSLSRTAIGCEGALAAIEGREELRELMLDGSSNLSRMKEPFKLRQTMETIAFRCPRLQYLHADIMPIMDRDGDSFTRNRNNCSQCRERQDRGDTNGNCSCTRRLQQVSFTIPL